MKQRSFYLTDIPLVEAYQRFWDALDRAGGGGRLPGEDVPVAEGLGRVTAAPVWAKISSPHYHASAMDGVAVRAAETVEAAETSPIRLRLETQAIWVDTG